MQGKKHSDMSDGTPSAMRANAILQEAQVSLPASDVGTGGETETELARKLREEIGELKAALEARSADIKALQLQLAHRQERATQGTTKIREQLQPLTDPGQLGQVQLHASPWQVLCEWIYTHLAPVVECMHV